MKNNLEICCGSYSDAKAAYIGGADQIELNAALSLGGLTPSLASLKRIKDHFDIPVFCMVRSRPAGFHYSIEEIDTMFLDAKIFLDDKADGIVFGFLNEDKTIDQALVCRMVQLIHSFGKIAVFHRAIDVTPNLETSIQQLIEVSVDRVLTSGGKATAIEGAETIAHLQHKYGDQIELLAGSGINEHNASSFIKDTNVHFIHSSCKTTKLDPTTSNKFVSYAYLSNDEFEHVDIERVQTLIKAIL